MTRRAWPVALGTLLIAASTLGPASVRAQTAASARSDPAFTVPTTRLLAIGTFTAGARPEVWRPIVPAEMRQTARLYLSGQIDQWYVKTDQTGVVFILNVTDLAQAQAMLSELPLGRAGLMTFPIHSAWPAEPAANAAWTAIQMMAGDVAVAADKGR